MPQLNAPFHKCSHDHDLSNSNGTLTQTEFGSKELGIAVTGLTVLLKVESGLDLESNQVL